MRPCPGCVAFYIGFHAVAAGQCCLIAVGTDKKSGGSRPIILKVW